MGTDTPRYGLLEPRLIASLRIHLGALDPLIEEPSLRLLTQVQQRHLVELGVRDPEPTATDDGGGGDLGDLPIPLGERRRLTVMAPLGEPARDAYVEVTPEGDRALGDALVVDADETHVPTDREEQRRFFHALMDAELCAAELMARNSHEHPEMPWDFHVDMVRQCWDGLRHAEVHDGLMNQELDCRWGDFPVGLASFKSIYAHDLLGRLALSNRTSEQTAT